MFLLLQAFLGLFHILLKFWETVHELCKGISIFFPIIAVTFLSNGCFSAETILQSPIFLVLTALTSIVGHMRTPMFLAQHAAFLDSHFFRDMVVIGTTTAVEGHMGAPLILFCLCRWEWMSRKIGVGRNLSDVVMSWLRLQTHTDCIPYPFHMYTKYFSILLSYGWAYQSACTLLLCFCQVG